MLRRWLVVPATLAAIALAGGCSSEIAGSSASSGPEPTAGQTTASQTRASETTAAETTAAETTAASDPAGTERIVLRPVDADGNVAGGFVIDPAAMGDYPIDCDSGVSPARSAVDDNIFYCSPNAAAAFACWPSSSPDEALCLMDPFEPVVTPKTTERPMGTVSAPATPEPFGLQLADGNECVLRHGSAWGSRSDDPSLYGAYGCDSPTGQIIWSAGDSPIDTSAAEWTVQVGNLDGPLRTVEVERAYYVGVAQ